MRFHKRTAIRLGLCETSVEKVNGKEKKRKTARYMNNKSDDLKKVIKHSRDLQKLIKKRVRKLA